MEKKYIYVRHTVPNHEGYLTKDGELVQTVVDAYGFNEHELQQVWPHLLMPQLVAVFLTPCLN